MEKTVSNNSTSLVTLLMVSLIFLAGQFVAVQSVTAKDLKSCQVAVSIVETIYAGKECVCFSPVFEIYNPNRQNVLLSKFSYELNVGNFYFSGQQIPLNLYIPPKKKVSFVGAVPAGWTGMSLWLMQVKGISMGEAMVEVIPLWKDWGAKLFNPKLKEAWGKAKAQCPPFIFNGEYEISSDEITSKFTYEAAWSG